MILYFSLRPESVSRLLLDLDHIVINDKRKEYKIKGRRIGHTRTGERGRGLLCISTTVEMLAGLALPCAHVLSCVKLVR